MANKNLHIIGALWAKDAVEKIASTCKKQSDKLDIKFHLMPGMPKLDVMDEFVDSLIADPATKIIIVYHSEVEIATLQKIRKTRKDIFLVTLYETTYLTPEKQYIHSLNFLKETSSNLVYSVQIPSPPDDNPPRYAVSEERYMVITPEETQYHVSNDVTETLTGLIEMTYLRSHLTFTRSTVIAGESIAWDSELIPDALRTVVNYCIEQGAYKPFRGATVGHFAAKVNDTTFITSKRKTNFNDLTEVGMVKIVTDGPDSVIAYGSKPSVGGQSQRIVFHDHQEYDCIVHFHSPIKVGSKVPIVSQRLVECGSMACGQNTSNGLQRFGNLSVVYLDNHGPNIVFNRNIDPQEVIKFIDENFDLSQKTGGYVSLGQILRTPDTLETAIQIF